LFARIASARLAAAARRRSADAEIVNDERNSAHGSIDGNAATGRDMFDSAVTGAQIGPYKIVRRLGGGDSADVLLATRSFPGDFERRVVIKRLRAFDDRPPDEQHALATEAVAYARVAHPAIVQLFDFFTQDGEIALVLEYVDGPSLSRLVQGLRLRRESLGDRATYFIMSRVFAALAAAHSARDPGTGSTTPVIHRDVNPDNVLVPWDGFAKLGDFDLAKVVGVSSDTRNGLLKGTYGYMAPEQVAGEPVTPRTDVYAACLLLRELLLDRPTFNTSLPELEILRAMDEADHTPIETLRGGISPRLADAMQRGLARDPARRTLSAGEMVEVLRAQTDMEAAHAELISILGRVRAREERGTKRQRAVTPPTGLAAAGLREELADTLVAPPSSDRSRPNYPTPRATVRDVMQSVPPIGATLPPRPREWRTQVAGVVAVAACIGALAAVYVVAVLRATSDSTTESSLAGPQVTASVRRSVSSSPSAPAPAPLAEAPLAPLAKEPPRDARSAAPSSAQPKPTTGELQTPKTFAPHRVFIDGKVQAWQSGESIRIACGTHVVRIGSHGAVQTVDVPCGGSVMVEEK
jgi:serine/threonine-protein kinase